MKKSLCCLNMYSDCIFLQINNFFDGFSELFWYKENSDITYKTVLKGNKIIVSKLSEGYYYFFTRNPSNSLETEPISFYVNNNLPSYIVNRLWNSANIEATVYSTNLKVELLSKLERSPSSSLLKLMYESYCNIPEIEEFEEDIFYRLMLCQEAYENLQNSNYNRDNLSFARLIVLPSPIITVPDDITLIKVYKISGNSKQLCKVYRPVNGTVTVPLMVGFFEIHLMQDSCLFNVFYHCNLSERSMIKMWEDYQNNKMDYLDIIENNLSSSMSLDMFSTEEVTNYKQEVGMNPMNAVIPRIQVTEEQYLRGVNLLISGVSFASTSQHTFFVSGRDIDFLSEEVKNEFIPLTGDNDSFTTVFDPATSMLDKEALLYVVDEQGTIVSRVTRCLFDEDSTTNLSNYYEKIRQTEINSYGRRLLSQILSSYSEGWTYAQEMISRCIENEEVTVDNILTRLLTDVYSAPYGIDKDLLSVEILKDFITSSQYDLSFFSDEGITWRPITHTIISEPSTTGYILCILAKFEGAQSYSTHYVHSLPDQTVEVLLNHYGSYAIYAISELDYSYSGFIYVNTTTGFLKSYLVNFGVK